MNYVHTLVGVQAEVRIFRNVENGFWVLLVDCESLFWVENDAVSQELIK